MTKNRTKLNLKNRSSRMQRDSRYRKKNLRAYKKAQKRKYKTSTDSTRNKIIKLSFLSGAVLTMLSALIVVLFLNYLSNISQNLPSPDNPFAEREQSSIIYANTQKDGENIELYRVFDTENRNLLSINDVPDYVKWTVMSAEDIDFYEHAGFDIGGIVKAIQYSVFGVGEPRGGSTITQQLIKQTTLGNEVSYERKIKEILLAIKVEQKYSKDQILEMYLNTNNYGGNVYGLKTAANFYFGKKVNELTLGEAALLARIPQNPANNSPTISQNPTESKARALLGKDFVLSQMENNLDKINSYIENDDEIITVEDIEKARNQKHKYKAPEINLEAGHFVFYVQDELISKNYNNGKPFTLEEIQTGGYKIYTSLNYDIQKATERQVLDGVNSISKYRNGYNGAAIVVNPKNGDILSMVGSKDFNGTSEGKLFDPKVNVTTSLQSLGSSMKPFGYYKAFQMGIASPGSYLPDVPISLGNYKPKNWDNSFNGYFSGATPRQQLRTSRNIPAVMLVAAMGIQNYTNTLIDFGYETLKEDPSRYGPSLVLGGGDVTMVEHAQGYSVLANEGNYIPLDPILKITKFNPQTNSEDIIYEKKVKSKSVADPKAVYMVNHILNYKNSGPGAFIDGRDHSGKTGTSELHKDTIYAGYTPEVVIIGWNGNNDNTPMIYGSWGENVTKPWVINLTREIAGYFPEKQPFTRPGGITTYKGDLSIEGLYPNDSLYLSFAPAKPKKPTPTPTPKP